MSRDELIVVVERQAEQIAQLVEANEVLSGKLARLEHLLSRNSGNSSNPPSRDDHPGKPAPPDKQRGRGGPKRARGKQPGTPGSHLAWTDDPNQRRDRFPEGRCGCGDDLARARDLGVVDRYQQHEIPQVAVTITQYDQHRVECGCGRRHTASRPEGARPGPVGYGPNLAAFAVYLMVVHYELAALLHADQDEDHELTKLIEARNAQQQRKDQLVKDYATGLLSRDELAQAKIEAQAALDTIDAQIAQRGQSTDITRLTAGESVHEAWLRNGNDWRRSLIQLLITDITVMPSLLKPPYWVDGQLMHFDTSAIRIN